MHATQKLPKQHQQPSPDLPNLTTQHIGPIGKCKLLFTDPYSRGEQLDKWAKADALSAPANACFCSLATLRAKTCNKEFLILLLVCFNHYLENMFIVLFRI